MPDVNCNCKIFIFDLNPAIIKNKLDVNPGIATCVSQVNPAIANSRPITYAPPLCHCYLWFHFAILH